MLNAFVPQPQGLARFELRSGAAIPVESVWLDLVEPTPSEEKQVESFLSIDVPTRDEMREIEASNRLYEEDGALYMTATVVTKLDSDLPESTQITFILSGTKLVTNRYVDPLPFRRFIAYAERHPNSCNSPAAVLAGLLESIIAWPTSSNAWPPTWMPPRWRCSAPRGASAASCAISASCSNVWDRTANSSPRRAKAW
jgi:magnesium transporter